MTTSLATAPPRVEDQDLLDRVIAEQGGRPGSLLSILEKLQEQHRNKYLPMETLEYVAARTGVPQAQRLQRRHLLRALQPRAAGHAHGRPSAAAPPATPAARGRSSSG